MFITYVVLDPRKTGRFCSPLATFLWKPVYVGKGRPNRPAGILNVLSGATNLYSGHRINRWLIGMRKRGFADLPIVVFGCESEDLAFANERVLTHHFGLQVEGGILLNERHGGDDGWTLSEETKRKLSIANTGENNPNWGTQWSEERRAKWFQSWKSKERSKPPEQMAAAWAATRKTYLVTDPHGVRHMIDDLTNFCLANNLPLSSFRKALKKDGTITSGSRGKSRAEGWKIHYINR